MPAVVGRDGNIRREAADWLCIAAGAQVGEPFQDTGRAIGADVFEVGRPRNGGGPRLLTDDASDQRPHLALDERAQ